ncbi:MAG: transglycosylase SLT domain-containing protein [Holosporales bacterium]
MTSQTFNRLRRLVLMVGILPSGLLANEACTASFKQAMARPSLHLATSLEVQGCRIHGDVVRWKSLLDSEGDGRLADLLTFIEAHPQWPGLGKLAKKAEKLMLQGTYAPQHVVGWMNRHPARSAAGALAHIEALTRLRQTQHLRALTTRYWRELDWTAEEARTFLAAHGAHIAPHALGTKLDQAVINKETALALVILARMPQTQRAVYDAHMKMVQGQMEDGMRLLQQLPLSAWQGTGAHLALVKHYRAKRDPKAYELLLQSAGKMHDPALWWRERNLLARRAYEEGDPALAYKLLAGHGLTSGSDRTDAEWFMGWLALRHLKKPQVALTHFQHVREGGVRPITKSRAHYWLARTAEALGDPDMARSHYQQAATLRTTFYGQLAMDKLGLKLPPLGALTLSAEEKRKHQQNSVYRAAHALAQAGLEGEAQRFLVHAASETKSHPELKYALHLASQIAPRGVVELVRKGTKGTELYYREAFPMLPKALRAEVSGARMSLVHAIIRRESNFDPQAVSHAGAMGLMQLTADTAKRMAKRVSLPFQKEQLLRDIRYNVRLGVENLKYEMEKHDQSIVLSLGAYNAGPNPVKEWVERFGDPRQKGIDLIDWIESIPYGETRNYIQRVLENERIYRQLF